MKRFLSQNQKFKNNRTHYQQIVGEINMDPVLVFCSQNFNNKKTASQLTGSKEQSELETRFRVV